MRLYPSLPVGKNKLKALKIRANTVESGKESVNPFSINFPGQLPWGME